MQAVFGVIFSTWTVIADDIRADTRDTPPKLNQTIRKSPLFLSSRQGDRGWGPALLVALLVVRLPSLVQPAGGDQGLYTYAAQRILAGDVMYRDVWDQKPPGIALMYAPLLAIWPGEAVVPGADLAAAAAVAILLVVLGRRRYSLGVGFGAGAVFLLFGDPYLQRLSGIYVRGQCEPFIALAVTASLVLLAHRTRRPLHLIGAGVGLAVAFWLKYNAAAYALPIALATWVWRPDAGVDRRSPLGDLILVGIGFVAVAAALILYFSVTGALADLRLATIDYNLQYSNETYGGPFSVVSYLATFPFQRARVDMLWFLGGVGALLLAGRSWPKPSTRGRPDLGAGGSDFHRGERQPRAAQLLRAGEPGPGACGKRGTGHARELRCPRAFRYCESAGCGAVASRLRYAGLGAAAGVHARADLERRLRPSLHRWRPGSRLVLAPVQRAEARCVRKRRPGQSRARHNPSRGRDLRVRVLGRQRRLEERAAELVTFFLEPAGAHRVCRGSPGIRLGGPP